jgi:hypothetical protein
LNLDGVSEFCRLARRNDEVAPFGLTGALDDLTKGTDGVDDRATGGIGHERCQRLQRATAVGLTR